MAWQELYPFKAHYITTSEGHRMHFIMEGEGAPVVMVHGNPTWSFMFRDVIRAVAKNGQQAIAVDLIGCGLSDKPQDWPYRLDGHIRNLEQLINDELKLPKVSLILHDWGGPIGMGYAVRHPEKIDRITLMNTAAYISTDVPKSIYLALCPFLGALLVRGFNLLINVALRKAPAKPLPKDVRDGYRFPYQNWHDRIAVQRFPQDLPLKPQHPSYQTLLDIENKLPILTEKRITLIWGEKDFCFPVKFLRRWQSIFPKARTFTFPNASHFLLEDAKDQILPILL